MTPCQTKKCSESGNIEVYFNKKLWKTVRGRYFRKFLELRPQYEDLKDFIEHFSMIEKRVAYDIAMRRLAQRASSSDALRKRLEEAEISKKTIKFTIERCKENLLLDDRALAKLLVLKEVARKSGPQKIRYSLQKQGLDKELIEISIEKEFPQSKQSLIIEQLLSSRFAALDLSGAKEKRKVFQFLAQRGFSSELIQNAIENNCK